MPDYFSQVQDALTEAMANGWEPCPGKLDTLRRIVEHTTPEGIPQNWWPYETYHSVEFLSFLFTERHRAPKVIHDVARCPWVEGRDRKISFKAAKALLAQPVAESEIHN